MAGDKNRFATPVHHTVSGEISVSSYLIDFGLNVRIEVVGPGEEFSIQVPYGPLLHALSNHLKEIHES